MLRKEVEFSQKVMQCRYMWGGSRLWPPGALWWCGGAACAVLGGRRRPGVEKLPGSEGQQVRGARGPVRPQGQRAFSVPVSGSFCHPLREKWSVFSNNWLIVVRVVCFLALPCHLLQPFAAPEAGGPGWALLSGVSPGKQTGLSVVTSLQLHCWGDALRESQMMG